MDFPNGRSQACRSVRQRHEDVVASRIVGGFRTGLQYAWMIVTVCLAVATMTQADARRQLFEGIFETQSPDPWRVRIWEKHSAER
jgi:hypothetical protein